MRREVGLEQAKRSAAEERAAAAEAKEKAAQDALAKVKRESEAEIAAMRVELDEERAIRQRATDAVLTSVFAPYALRAPRRAGSHSVVSIEKYFVSPHSL